MAGEPEGLADADPGAGDRADGPAGPEGEGRGEEPGRAPIVIPHIAAEHRDEALNLARQIALRTDQVIALLEGARDLGLPDPDDVGFAGLDYDAIDAVGFGVLAWSGALLRGAGYTGDGLVRPSPRPDPAPRPTLD